MSGLWGCSSFYGGVGGVGVGCGATGCRWVFHRQSVFINVLAVLLSCVLSVRAFAGGLGNEPDLITETVASRDRARVYDNIGKYGAETMRARSRTHVRPDGGRVGNFRVFPSVGTDIEYDDNIFGSSTNAVDDLRFVLSPEVRIQSHLPRHILNMAVGANLVRFLENTDQDYTNAFASINGGLHIDHANTLGVSVLSEVTHEERNEITSSLSSADPVRIFHNKVVVGMTHDVGLLYGTLSVTAERYDYQDNTALDGGILDQDSRDTDFLSTQLRTGYRFSPGYELVAKMKFMRQLHAGDDELDLDAVGYEVVAGLAFEVNPLLRWRVLGGYGVRDYDDNTIPSTASGLFEAELEWLPTQRITVYGSAKREFIDTVGADVGGFISSSISARVDMEVLNNLVWSFGGGVLEADFTGDPRRDYTYTANTELQYYLNKNLLLSIGFEHITRDSNIGTFDMERNRFRIGAKWRY